MIDVPVQDDVLWNRRVSGGQYLEARRILNSAPSSLRAALETRYAALAESTRRYWLNDEGRVLDTWNEAHADLRRTGRAMDECRVRIAHDDDELEQAADQAARICMELEEFAYAVAYAQAQKVHLPALGGRVTQRSIVKRLRSADWWRRQLRTHLTRGCEDLFRVCGFVRDRVSAYVSEDGYQRVRAAAFKGRVWMANTSAVCEDTGEILPLAQIAEHSLANPAIRRGELMVRARGFQEVAELHGHQCLMITLTCPSAFHAWLRHGEANPRFEGPTPREGQAWLTHRWASARAALKRQGVLYYGFRVAEPHHDATPHWHMVIYAQTDALETIRAVLTRTWLSQYGDEPGASQHRIKFTAEHPAKGSGVGYLAKYISKNIDAAGSIGAQSSDESNHPVTQEALRAVAWARLHGIRQFQQLGGPAVTLWRHLRRVREPCEWPPLEVLRLTTTEHSELAPLAIQQAGHDIRAGNQSEADEHVTDSGEDPVNNPIVIGPSWSKFIAALGGISQCLVASRSYWDKQEPRTVDPQGRRVMRVTRWGELPAPIIVGLQVVYRDRIRRLPTRLHVWVLIFTPGSGRLFVLGPVAITVAGAPAAGSPAGWTNPHETSQAPP